MSGLDRWVTMRNKAALLTLNKHLSTLKQMQFLGHLVITVSRVAGGCRM